MLWARSDGVIVEYDMTGNYTPTINYPRSVEVPGSTNATLVGMILFDMPHYTIGSGSTLLRDGQPVTIVPGGMEEQDLAALPAIMTKLMADQNLNQAETRVVLRALIRAAMPIRYGGTSGRSKGSQA